MIGYAKEELVGVTELGKSLGNYLDRLSDRVYEKIAVIRRNKPEAVMISLEEYERLKEAADRLEQQEIEEILKRQTPEEREVSHSKIVSLEYEK